MSDGAHSPIDSLIPTEPLKHKAPRNIVVCCDGTGNEFGDANSNVVKLYTALAIDNEQVGYYHPGVGTMGNPAIQHAVSRWWSKVKGLAFAAGFKDNVLDAYRYLMETYNDGDRVFLFGFSRGAYTARALAGLLDGFGLLCRGNEGHIPYAWRLYTNQHKDRKRRYLNYQENAAGAFKETFSRKDFHIHFVGVWDTVSSVGWISSPLRLFNEAQNRSIHIGRHAISIDERRCFYRDVLWGEPLPGQDLKQVWFAGVHSDVGGSYGQDESALSNIALEWMLSEAESAGVKLVDDRVRLIFGESSSSYPDAQPLYRKPTRSIVHQSLKGAWWALEFFPHIFYEKDGGKEMYRIPLGAPRDMPAGSLVHHSVFERMQNAFAVYQPASLDPQYLQPLPGDETAPGTPFLYLYDRPKNTPVDPVKRILLLIAFSLLDFAVLGLAACLVVGAVVWLWVQIRHGVHGFLWG
jgi:uncharacterized protein (DUF2235 family)